MDLELTVFCDLHLVAVPGMRQSILAFLYTTSSHDDLFEYINETNPILNNDVSEGCSSLARRKACSYKDRNISSDDVSTTQ
jgi:hypothetical protein